MTLDHFFAPRSVAVVGVGREPGGVGRSVFRNLIASGYSGGLFPVNPRLEDVEGRTCYPNVAALPEVPDLAVIAVPAAVVPGVVRELGVTGTRCVIVISAGFKETGREGAALERELMAAAAENDVRILGPNCLGLIATPAKLNASFSATWPRPGGTAFMSQSGALGTAVLDWAKGRRIGLSSFVSLGNRADVSESDLLDIWREDDGTRTVVAYLESIADGPAFVEAATKLTAVKPLVVLKSGGSDAGARAVSSHTGSLAGSDAAYDAAFRRSGVIRAHTVQDLFDFAEALSRQPLPAGPGLAILTNAGGPAIMATDACDFYGVTLAGLDRSTTDALREALPAAAALFNPVDVLGDALAARYSAALDALSRDPNVRSVLVVLTPQAPTQAVETARSVVDFATRTGVTTLACFMGADAVAEASRVLADGGVPAYKFPERAIASLAAMERVRENRTRPRTVAPPIDADRDTVRARIDSARAAGRTFVTDEGASSIAQAYGLPTPASALARDLASARVLAAEIGYPLALKIASPDILHKSDIGGIRLGIKGEGELAAAYEAVIGAARDRMPDADVWGVTLQAMVPAGREVIVGVDRDPQFGPLLMFGLGGIYVEVLHDVVFRLCPVSPEDAREMISEIRGFGLLRGARGQAPADIDAIVDVLVRVSALAVEFPDITEMDINPLIVMDRGGGAVVADVRIGIGG
ncbi:MAG: acetate--CoA ligase family protein [Coriobacteriia bacterium]|nr:acetate--CoA ligase family protein [Coriobacteriia bacterium]